MSIKYSIWDAGKAKVEIQKRYKNAARAREKFENRWVQNERSIYSTSSINNFNNFKYSMDFSITEALGSAVDQSNADVNVAYTFKNLRFIHAQMSANPPSVAMRPTSSDQEDHRRADAADRIVRWALRHYAMQEKVDQMNLQALLYGTCLMKTVWDSTKGAILDVDEKSGEMKLEGDITITVPFMWNIFIDPDAKSWPEVKYVIERIYMDYEEACARWPDKQDELKAARIEESETPTYQNGSGRNTELRDEHYNAVQLLEYWETGLPTNGYLGRYCITTIQGEVIEKPRPNPFRFKKAGGVYAIENNDNYSDEQKEALIRKLPEQARLPFHILTDIDIPNSVLGRSAVEYATQLQQNVSRIDTATLDNIQAHGVARMILPESAEIDENALSDSGWDVVKITGNQPPYFMSPPQLMPDMTTSRNVQVQGINDVMGVNESMFGQQSREQSGASMQYATNQGNMVRRRLFNKYVGAVESIYNGILDLCRKHWSVERTINVLGKEHALEAVDIKGADIDGGYDVIGEYGVTLSLDPISRREEIITLQPLFEKAGVPPRTALKMLKLNELEGMYDSLEKAGLRQKEIFDRMIATQAYIKPKRFRDHENMIAWAMDYFMSSEFENLSEDLQLLCEAHIEERAMVAAQEKSPSGVPAGGAPSPAMAPGAPGVMPAPAPIPGPGPAAEAGPAEQSPIPAPV